MALLYKLSVYIICCTKYLLYFLFIIEFQHFYNLFFQMDPYKQSNSLISSGAPTRANEKGTCPTCNRQFGIKAYDRHVAWCKDRVTRVPVSPATNRAKERLEARMRYRAPALKNRRAINREKYSPGSAANQAAKTSLSSPTLVSKPKESVSSVSCNRESPVKQKPVIV